MSKKFKLIKKYPGSPELGSIVSKHSAHTYIMFDGIYPAHSIENHPEFWEEIIKPTYKILSFRSLQSFKAGHIVDMEKNNYGPEKYLKSDYWEINSIKRLSDNVVFTIGNVLAKGGHVIHEFEIIDNTLYAWCVHPSFSCPTKGKGGMMVGNMFKRTVAELQHFDYAQENYKILRVVNSKNNFVEILESQSYSLEDKLKKFPYLKITSIKRLSDGEIFTIDDKTNYGTISSIRPEGKGLVFNNNYTFGLSELKKIKKPLFITEDGVKIFEGDKHYPVELKWHKLHLNAVGKMYASSCRTKFKIFSTKEAAERYIFFNKPCLSIKDVENAFSNLIQNRGTVIQNLKKLINDK